MAREKQEKVNVVILQSISDLQGQGPLIISHGQEDRSNGAYGSRSHGGHMLDRDERVRYGRFLDRLDRQGSRHGIYSSSSSDMYQGHHRYHPYRRSDMGYILDEFKKAKPPTFDGKMKKS